MAARRQLARGFVGAAWVVLLDTALAATPTCRTDADCSPPTPLCRSFALSRPPQRLCIAPIPATGLATDGANSAERGQELRITTMLGALDERADALRPQTLSELRDVLDREVRAPSLDDVTLAREVREAHAQLQQLDRYERLVLLRYLKRHFSTELERWLFIILDVVRHPDLDPSTELAALEVRIHAEQLRLRGILSDRAAQCAQIAVLKQLNRDKIAAELALDVRRFEASNVAPAQREALIESARRLRQNLAESTSVIMDAGCSGDATRPGPAAAPPVMPPLSRKPARPRYTLYSLDPPEMVILADAAGVPPVGSGSWDRANAGKRSAQRRATSEQQKRASEGRRPFELQASAEEAAALKLLEAESKAISCATDAACDAAKKAVQKRHEGRIAAAADRLKSAPAGDPPVTARPSYAGLQPYDTEGRGLDRRFAKTGFFKWLFSMLAENHAFEAIHHHTHVKLDPLPPSMVSSLHVAAQLAKLGDARTPRELACWGADLHKVVTFPYAPDSHPFDRMMQSVLQLKSPDDPDFVPCPKK